MEYKKQGVLLISCGVPGSGKTTKLKSFPWNGIIISRDDIRFELLGDNFNSEEYFSKEEEVWERYIFLIRESLKNGINVIADATHLTPNSRRKLINEVKDVANPNIIAMNFHCSLNRCLERNEKRKGTIAYVPREQIKRIYYSYMPAIIEEGFYDVLEVDLNYDNN